jgi:uncharacterized protein
MNNALNWVEIPALDIQRAAAFYSTLYDTQLNVIDQTVRKLVILPHDSGAVGVAVNQSQDFQPGSTGPLVYLNAGQDLTPMLARVESAGGKVVTPKTDLGGNGFYAIFRDSEGNHLALMSAT